MILLADDFTGAAEVAGVLFRHGIAVEMSVGPSAPATTALVVDTESRGLDPEAAGEATRAAFSALGRGTVLYKKTDSVLRGPVRREIEALLAASGAGRCLLVPGNPALGRIIEDGVYRIHGVDLRDTEFGADPTHPARTSRVVELLGPGRLPAHSLATAGPMPLAGIIIGETRVAEDLEVWARRLDPATLPAGGAAFLSAILEARGWRVRAPSATLPVGPRLLVSGSRSAAARALLAALEMRGEAVHRVPGGTAVIPAGARRAAVCIRDDVDADPSAMLELLCDAAMDALSHLAPTVLLAEGGATAAALARRSRWSRFRVAGELAPGVVALTPAGTATVFVVKPGSYPWPPGLP